MHHAQDFIFIKLNLLGFDISITSMVLTIWTAALIVFTLFLFASKRLKLSPSPSQGTLEIILEFLEGFTRDFLGDKGKKWLPLLIALFCFILFCNLLGLIPGFSPPTSNLNVTATLAILVFFVVQVYGFSQYGIKYFAHMIPEGIPWYLVPFLFAVEIMLQIAKPFALAVRLFANLFAGHATMLVIIGLILIMKNKLFYPLPMAGYVLLGIFEIFMGFVQAFIFTLLTIFYLSEVTPEKQT